MKITTLAATLAALAVLPAVPRSPADVLPPGTSWKAVLAGRVPAYGHRNWIVIADSAYPAQGRPGIDTVVTGADQLEVVREVLDQLGRARHVRPAVFLDAELPHVPEKDAPGIGAYRDKLKELLGDRPVESLPHEQIIDRLDQAAAKFNVLVLKSNLTLPYTSVFLRLECGYWGDDAEKRLRREIDRAGKKP
jgi:hypothetical protein